VALAVARKILCLPIYPDLDMAVVEKITNLINGQ
jgi:dTDP-4-amino-4,6-dideoxygalactose transaminase